MTRTPLFRPLLLSLYCGMASTSASASSHTTEAPLRVVDSRLSTRRVLANDEVREYYAVELRFGKPLYARVCEAADAVFVEAASRCLRCPEGCVLSSLLSDRSWPLAFTESRRPESHPDCLCNISFEELRLRLEGWPGDPGVEDLERVPAELMEWPERLEAYATALWQHSSLMLQLTCPESSENHTWPGVQRFGLNGLPLAESLWWLRRFDTAFGLEDMDSLLANASREYDERQAVFFLPLRRTRNGRTQQLGPDWHTFEGCRLDFPHLAGPSGEVVPPVQVRAVPASHLPCSGNALTRVHKQMKAVLAKLPSAGRQARSCRENWRTSLRPEEGDPAVAGARAAAAAASQPQQEGSQSGRQVRRGLLSLRVDFNSRVLQQQSEITCAELRWQLRARAHYTRERALAYTATDAANGCWDLMERLVTFQSRNASLSTDECTHAPDSEAYWSSPCCNPRALRRRCCAVRNTTVQRPVAAAANTELLARQCRPDSAGAAAYARAALSAALAWRQRLAESSGSGSCWRTLMVQEQAWAGSWRTLQRCHADVLGRYDRDLRMYSGGPCLVDEDCLTRCIRPVLPTLQKRRPVGGLSRENRQFLGRCHVPTRSQHVFILRCLVQRAGAEVLVRLGAELGLSQQLRDEQAVAQALAQPAQLVRRCVGPFAAPGAIHTEQSCLAAKSCNWNHEIDSTEECERPVFENEAFCGCREGFCFQQSLKGGCVDGTKLNNYCFGARELLLTAEVDCTARASTPGEMSQCDRLCKAHSRMLRDCLTSGCGPSQSLAFSDEKCVDVIRRQYASCHEQCTTPSGPNPSSRRTACYRELLADESAADCFKTPGDAQLHWAPLADGGELSLELPEDLRKPNYCSVRVWRQLAPVQHPRSRLLEGQRLAAAAAERQRNATEVQQRSEGSARAAAVQLARLPPTPTTCDLGILPLDTESAQRCSERQEVSRCCLSPVSPSSLQALCVPCAAANTTVCRIGSQVQALWSPNMQRYPARLAVDIGGGFTLVDWDDGGTEHRQVPWVWVNTRGGMLCTAETEGCAAHTQCSTGEYCYGCTACAEAHGGNPPPELCAPCPTPRGGACGRVSRCQRLQDGVNGTCPPGLELQCPCKAEWSVRFQYPGAPMETSILGCWYDISKGYHWCEVDGSMSELCEAEMITGQDRFIQWRRCTPASCSLCNCNCSKTSCMAYNIIPVEGRLPAEVAVGDLGQVLSPGLLEPAGLVAPNCSDGSFARVRGLCSFCVSCCASYCHLKAQTAEAGASPVDNATKTFDCTATDVTGCSDSPRGWSDSIGRTCRDYTLDDLCTPGGQFGTKWIYNPPRTFLDFAMNGRAATDACCGCGGGGDCSNSPAEWTDPGGIDCVAYAERGWCNRTGYGPNWDPSWGAMELGTGSVDAISACCSCGGGRLVAPPSSVLLMVDDVDTCARVWPGRAQFANPPWLSTDIDLCRLISGVCMRKLTALVFNQGLSTALPDDPRIWGLCEQRAFETGRLPLSEDGQRRLTALDQNAKRWITTLQRQLQYAGTSMSLDPWGNNGLGMCIFRLPDPFGLFGGPQRLHLPPPWLPERNSSNIDLFEPPSIHLLGWPSEFWRAFPETDADLTRPESSPDQELSSVSSALRAALAAEGVELVLPTTFSLRLGTWRSALASATCDGGGSGSNGEAEFGKFQRNIRWDPASFADQQACERPRCDLETTVTDAETCSNTQGCTASCPYCASRAVATYEQGLCYTSNPPDVSRCDDLGGVLVDSELVFDELLGVGRPQRICAMPHRPLTYCTSPGEQVKRCAHFDVNSCESDPLARLLGCAVGLRRCQTREECSISGRCTDAATGLTWALPGTCVITPPNDDLLREGCDSQGLCYLHLDPPFGMEVRRRHGLLDLLDAELASSSASAFATTSGTGSGTLSPDELLAAGRLNRTECESLHSGQEHRAVWLERAHDALECQRWRSCCLAWRGEVCELYSGPMVDAAANVSEALLLEDGCRHCGGDWVPVFHWEQGTWRSGQIEERHREWFQRRWGDANEWAEVVDIDYLRRLYENAEEARLGEKRLNAAKCLMEPLMAALASTAAACGTSATSAAIVGDGSSAASQLPSTRVLLGSIETLPSSQSQGVIGSIMLSWHAFSASLDGGQGVPAGPGTTYELSLEPMEFQLAAAAPQIALPGRAENARSRIVDFALTGETTTTAAPQYETERVDGGEGYPAWLINQMANLDESQETADFLAGEEVRLERQQRLELERQRAAAADASSGLPAASQALLTGAKPPALPSLAASPLDFTNGTCRSTVANVAGEVMGQLLGDCVHLAASSAILNSVELCLPLTQEMTLNMTPQGRELGVVLDFARRDQVPETYNISSPPPLALGSVPGQLGSALWLWESGPVYGRLPPGWSFHTPLDVQTQTRTGGGGFQLCAKVYHAGWSYCPIARLASSIHMRLPQMGQLDEIPPVDSSCPQLDTVLASIQGAQVAANLTSKAYVRTDMQVSEPSALESSPGQQQQVATTALCPVGQCLAMTGREFLVTSRTAPDCTLSC